ncbi:MAG TPA: hypothetical protein VL995_08425 [Cellvibrio sp.]|nr:hypothetical protein [Cellvibrio sp.]
MKSTIITASITLVFCNLAYAHKGHEHGPAKEEAEKMIKEGLVCVMDDKVNSVGAVLEKDGKIYRCVNAYGKNLEAQAQPVWIELKVDGNALRTVP